MKDDPDISIPVILLKNPSSGHTDPYTTLSISSPPSQTSNYKPLYVPVLEHTFNLEPISRVLSSFQKSGLIYEDSKTFFPYGGLIFTSQRAVEAFASALHHFSHSVNDSTSDASSMIAQSRMQHLIIPLYAVGPATAQSLDVVRRQYLPRCWSRGGDEAGTGELLAELIVKDYNTSLENHANDITMDEEINRTKKPFLFLTGAKHRDIIPITLTSHSISVDEMVVYATSESSSFASDIASALESTTTASVRWIVIFSPTGGEALLRALGWLEESSNKFRGTTLQSRADRRTFIASIGPTTRDYMKTTFGLDVDVCAEKPSPEGVRKGIEKFMRAKGLVP